MFEREVFKRRTILFDKLESFGFIRQNNSYIYKRKIYDGMIASVVISFDGTVSGDVFDEELNESYVNFRLDTAVGAFVTGVKNAYLALLEEIAEAVTEQKTYANDQTNRIGAFIEQTYFVKPEFLWQRFPHFGVYRNADSKKWFAIIMDIGRGKIFAGDDGEIEVMNLKLDGKAEEYVKMGAAHPSYHMNHKSWVTVVFEDGVSDQTIKEMIAISFENTKKR